MKTRNILACVSALIFSSVAPRAFAGNGWYAGVDLGRAGYSGLHDIGGPFGKYYHTVDIPFVGSNTDHHSAYRVTVGYQLDPHFALEAGYQDLGQVEINGMVTYLPSKLDRFIDEKLSARGFVADAVGRWPFADGWALYGRAGEFLSHVDHQLTQTSPNPVQTNTASGGKFTYGVGVAWSSSGPFGVKLGWDRFANLGESDSTGQFSVNTLSLGLTYSF